LIVNSIVKKCGRLNMESALAIILAGGQGKRMNILCKYKPKPTLPFAGNTRVIDYVLSNCVYSQLRDITILTDYQRSAMAIYLRNWSLRNGNQVNISVLEPTNNSYLGTADAVFQNLKHIKKYRDELILILAGDHIYKMDYQKMLAFHCQTGADATLAVSPISIAEAQRFGIVTTDDKGRIIDFIEKPRIPESNLASMGIYIFNRQFLIERLTEDAGFPGSQHDFEYDILPSMIRRHRIFAYQFDDYWQDIGTPEAYYESNMGLLRPKPAFSPDGEQLVLTLSNYLLCPTNDEQGGIVNSLVSPGCKIKGRVENSILSPGVRIEEEAEVKNSIVMQNSFIGRHSVVDHCVLDENVNVGRFCYLGLGGTIGSGKTRVTVVGEGVMVPSHTGICRNCKILPGVGLDDFTERLVPPNSIVTPLRFAEPRQAERKGSFTNVRQVIHAP